MALSATLLFYAQYTKSGAGVTGKSGSITFTIKKLVRGSTPTITTVSTGGGITVGSVTEVDSSNAKGLYVVGVSGLDPAADYVAGAAYTGTASDVDLVDVPALWSEFSPAVAGGVVPQVAAGASGGVLIGSSTFDGLSLTSIFELLIALAAGKDAVADNGDGTKTVTFKKQDGTTTKFTVTYNYATEARTASSVS